ALDPPLLLLHPPLAPHIDTLSLHDALPISMKDVGDRFGAGELILPFVLQSAEVMKRSVSHLEQYLEKQAGYSKGSIVVATVYGRSEEHTSELQSLRHLVCRLLLEKKKIT